MQFKKKQQPNYTTAQRRWNQILDNLANQVHKTEFIEWENQS